MKAEIFSGSQSVCPNCGSPAIRRWHRQGWAEKLVLWLRGLRPFRCRDCHFRFYSRAANFAG